MSFLDLHLDLDNSFGALLLGTIVSSMLYGAMCLQSWNYFQKYSDGPLIKSAVAALIILESLHSAFSIHAIYYYLVSNYSNPIALLTATWSAVAVLLVTHLIRMIVEAFYTWRVYIVSQRNIPLAISIAVLELMSVGTGLAVPFIALRLQFFSEFTTMPISFLPADISLALAATVDIMIAGSLSIYLHRSKAGISRTNKIIDRLVVHAVNNGIITSITSVLCLIFALTDKTNLMYLTVYQCIAHLYSNTVLSTLNTRKSTSGTSPSSLEISGHQTLEFRVTVSSPLRARRPTMKSTQENLEMDTEMNIHGIVE